MPSLVGLGFHLPPGWPKTLTFLCVFVCLFITILNVRDCAPDFAMKALEYRTILMPLDMGRFVVVHTFSTLSDCCQLVTTLNAEVQTTAKIELFRRPVSPPQDDRINRSRQNFAGRRIPWVCYSSPNLALIGKRGSVQEPPKMSKFAKLWFLATRSRHNEHIQLKFGL